MKRSEEIAHLAPIREAVLNCARAGVDSRVVVTVLLKQASEIAVTTHCATREEFVAVSEMLWDQSHGEHLERITSSTEPGDA